MTGACNDVNAKTTVVCDNGSGYVKAGFAGDLYPKTRLPCLVGRPTPGPGHGATKECLPDVVVGEACVKARQPLQLSRPITNGIIHNWSDMELVWDETFLNRLQVEPSDNRILLTDPPLNSAQNRQQLMEVMFEKYRFKSMYMQSQAVLALYSQGLMTGLVVDCGAALTHIVPVIEGYSNPAYIKRLQVAGEHVTQHLRNLLQYRGYTLSGAHTAAVQEVKERCCYIAIDYARERALAQETTCLATSYTLPDGQTLRLAAERFQAPEMLFQPHLAGIEAPGLAETIHMAIHELPIDTRLSMYPAVLLAGGTSMLPGLSTRLERDLRGLYLDRVLKGRTEGLQKIKLRVEDPPLRQHMVFTGASILADIMADFDDMWVSRADWEEDPASALAKGFNSMQCFGR